MAECEGEPKNFIMRVKGKSEKAGLKISFQKTKIVASCSISSWEIEKGKRGSSDRFILLHFKISLDGDCSHKIKRQSLLGRKAMTKLDSVLKSRDITLLTNVCLVKAMVFPVVTYGCESWTIRKAEQ